MEKLDLCNLYVNAGDALNAQDVDQGAARPGPDPLANIGHKLLELDNGLESDIKPAMLIPDHRPHLEHRRHGSNRAHEGLHNRAPGNHGIPLLALDQISLSDGVHPQAEEEVKERKQCDKEPKGDFGILRPEEKKVKFLERGFQNCGKIGIFAQGIDSYDKQERKHQKKTQFFKEIHHIKLLL